MNSGRTPAPPSRDAAHPSAPGRPVREDGPPPFLGTWARVYAAVLIWLGLLVLLMHLFTQAYR